MTNPEPNAQPKLLTTPDGIGDIPVDTAPSLGLRYTDPDAKIRPATLDEIIGQEHIKRTLRVYMRAAKGRGESLDHVLLTGPAGLGKTTIASVIAHEMGHQLRVLAGPQVGFNEMVNLASEMMADAETIENDYSRRLVVFIDEIHGMHKDAQNVLLPMLEDFNFGNWQFQPFTLIGATTDPSKLSNPLRDRFGIPYQLDFYPDEDIVKIAKRTLSVLLQEPPEKIEEWCRPPYGAGETPPEAEAITELARRARGVPRVINNLIKRTLDFMYQPDEPETPTLQVITADGRTIIPGIDDKPLYGRLTPEVVREAMTALGIDRNGLDAKARSVLVAMFQRYGTRPVGIRAVAAAIGESAANIEETVEPNLVRRGFINREMRGRTLTAEGIVVAAREIDGKTEY